MSCCLAVVMFFISICLLFVYFIGGLILLDIIFFFLFVGSLGRKENAKKMQPSKMICPNCQGTNVKISMKKTGYSSDRYTSKWGSTHGNIDFKLKQFARCESCGFSWDYITQQDIKKELEEASGSVLLFGFIFFILIIITIVIFV
jgi:hypothetical protein